MWRRSKTYITKPVRTGLRDELNKTQAKIAGFDPEALQASGIVLIGAGGIGSPAAMALGRKGVGHLAIIDDDVVELSNNSPVSLCEIRCRPLQGPLPRPQPCPRRSFSLRPSSRIPSASRKSSSAATTSRTQRYSFAAWIIIRRAARSASTRSHTTCPQFSLQFLGGGNECYAMVQQPRKACWACVFPAYVNNDEYPCNLPAINDVLMVLAGQIVFTVDTLIGDRPRTWNVRETFLDGSLPDRARTVERRSDCTVCGYVA